MSMTFIFVSCNKEAQNSVLPEQQTVSIANRISENGANPDETMMTQSPEGTAVLTETNSVDQKRNFRGHYLYSESNENVTNRIFIYQINNDGSLSSQGSVN